MHYDIHLRHALGGLTLDLALAGGPGVTVLFGPSGAGKTSVIRAVAGLLRPDEGRITLGDATLTDTARGLHLPAHRRRMGYVFQDGRLFPHLDVHANLRFGARHATRPAAPDQEGQIIDLLGIGGLLRRRPAALSGGEAQRVALARALLSDPEMLLMDEPLAALDAPRKADILPYLDRLKTTHALPILYVTHDLSEVARLADHVALMRDGRLVAHGPVFDILSDPAHIPLVGVREAGAVIEARVTDRAADGLTRLETDAGSLELPGVDAAIGETVRLRILARDVILARTRPSGLSARNILPVTIAAIEPGRGPGAALVLRAGSQRLLARITERSRSEMKLEPGQKIFAILKATAVARHAIGA